MLWGRVCSLEIIDFFSNNIYKENTVLSLLKEINYKPSQTVQYLKNRVADASVSFKNMLLLSIRISFQKETANNKKKS